jgi:hypothetical protein
VTSSQGPVPIVIERIAGPVTVRLPAFGAPVVEVDGTRIAGRRGFYDLPATNGQTIEARVRPGFMEPFPRLEVLGVSHRTGPETPITLRLAAILPAMLFAFGLLGALVGVVAIVTNWALLRSSLPALRKVGAIGLVLLASLVSTG